MALFLTPPLDIIDVAADSQHSGGPRRMPPQMIVLHHTGAWPALRWLTTDRKSNVSAHRYIEPHKPIYKLVPDERVAYTQGYADVGPWSDAGGLAFNPVCLSIEGCFDPTIERTWNVDVVWKMACQCCEWWGLYGFIPILYHWQVDKRKDDPAHFPRAVFDAWLGQLVYRAIGNQLKTWVPEYALPTHL